MASYQEFDGRRTVASLVRADHRAADVFRKLGISYCCGGEVPLQEACLRKGLELPAVVRELQAVQGSLGMPPNLDYASWKLDFLTDFLVYVHHAHLQQSLVALEAVLGAFVAGHRKKYPALEEVAAVFSELATRLRAHCSYEEEVIFPYIRLLETTARRKESYGSLLVRTLRKPLSSMDREGENILAMLAELRRLTHQYAIPEQACTQHTVVLCKLRDFDTDLLQHKQLEHGLLFPRAVEMEKKLLEES